MSTALPHARETLLADSQLRADLPFLTDALLAPLAADLYLHQRRDAELTPAAIKRGLDRIVDCILDGNPTPVMPAD